MQIFNNLNQYRRTPPSYSNIEEISQNKNADIKKDKWIDGEGNYADGVFVSQVRMGYKGIDGTVKRADATTAPYNNMFPFFIWFDTEFDIEY